MSKNLKHMYLDDEEDLENEPQVQKIRKNKNKFDETKKDQEVNRKPAGK